MYKLIGLRGKIGVGKDTAADFIVSEGKSLGIEYVVVRFADAVKLITSVVTSTTVESQYTREGKASTPQDLPFTLARYQQIVGESMRKLIHDDVWVRIALNSPYEYRIISDVRYENEAMAIEKAGGVVISITRPSVSDALIINDGRDREHSSETALDHHVFASSVINDSSLEVFRERVLELVKLDELASRSTS